MRNAMFFALALMLVGMCEAGWGMAYGGSGIGRNSCETVLIRFSGYDWWVKEGFYGPGPNHFANSNVWLDGENKLHLLIERRDSTWYCAEVYSDRIGWGYGVYRFYLSSRVDNLDSAAVLGLFTYDYNPPCQTFDCGSTEDCCDLYHCHCREIDIEFCAGWGNIGYFSVQPNRTSGECYGFDFALIGDSTTFQFEWLPGQVAFHGTHGHHSEMICPIPAEPYLFAPGIVCDEETLDFSTCPDCVFAPGNERVHINLWLWDITGDGIGDSLTSCEFVEIVIDSFEFIPDESLSVDGDISQNPVSLDIIVNPNPFNSAVRISVETLHATSLQIEIFDIAGRCVTQLPSPSVPLPKGEGGNSFSRWEKVSEGRMRAEFTWQPEKSLGSGVYLVRARVDGESVSNRIVYLK